MNSDEIYFKGVVVGREQAEILRVVPVNEITGTTTILSFNHEIIVGLETETVKKRFHDGNEIGGESSAHNDFYGFFTSCQDILLKAKSDKLIHTPPIYGEVWTTLSTRLMVEPSQPDSGFRQKKFRTVPGDWIVVDDTRNSRENVEKWRTTPWQDRFDIAPKFGDLRDRENILIWTSQNSPDENINLFRSTLDRFYDLGAAIDVTEWMQRYEEEMITPDK